MDELKEKPVWESPLWPAKLMGGEAATVLKNVYKARDRVSLVHQLDVARIFIARAIELIPEGE